MANKKISKKVISVYIDPALHIKAKVMAAKKGVSIGEIIEQSLLHFFYK